MCLIGQRPGYDKPNITSLLDVFKLVRNLDLMNLRSKIQHYPKLL